MMEVILPENTTTNVLDAMQQLIESAVQNAIENPEGLDLNSSDGIEDAGWKITDYLEVVTKEKVDAQVVITELKRQLI
ncbi:hypothetical protein [Acinetobacter radioresistens]|uniref:hypothetical protein n=1 Tax=Acinetobacter radioresistens TaxID=40216 RepID=UPI000553227D|nr:hypothetical protein [Acinetobacter radioresistens]